MKSLLVNKLKPASLPFITIIIATNFIFHYFNAREHTLTHTHTSFSICIHHHFLATSAEKVLLYFAGKTPCCTEL